MKFLTAFLLIGFGFQVWAQDGFPIKISDFSDQYEAVIDLNEEDTIVSGRYDDYVPEYVIQIFDKSNQKMLLKAYTADFPTYLLDEENEAVPNIKELPYGSQSVLLYEDYNFDGIKDFALMNGYESCYGGPSFDIYLAVESGFEHSEAFSILSNEYCGMFDVDNETQTIHTMTKSGCCWHQFSEFKVIDNEPKPVKITERSYLSYNNFIEVTEITYNNGKEKSTTNLYFPFEEMMSQIIVYFELEKSGKSVVLYEMDNKLHYVFLQEDDLVEFYFPQPDGNETEWDFNYHQNEETLTFSNEEAQYRIYETDDSVGIKVTTNGKTYDMQGVKSTAIGSLKNMKLIKLTNILIQN